MSKILQITVTSTIYTTLGDYLKDYRSPAFPYEQRKKGEEKTTDKFDWKNYAANFVAWTPYEQNQVVTERNKIENVIEPYLNDPEDKYNSNYARIVKAFKNYPDKLEEIKKAGLTEGGYLNLPIRPGIKFSIPIEKISRESLLTQGVEVVSNNEPAFKARKLIELEADAGYKKVFKQESNNVSRGNLKYEYPDITVWVWCRALSENPSSVDFELKGQIFNITPFVTELQTSNTKNGGNFSFSLIPAVAERDKDTGKWILKKYSTLISEDNRDIINNVDTHTDIESSLKRNQIFFHNAINTNDLVFIRYETLEMESSQRLMDNSEFVIDKSNLAGRIYDQIGLVDRNVLSNNFEINDARVNISGRDLSKLFIEDGTYFYAMEYKDGTYRMQGGASQKNELTQRVIGAGAHLYLGNYYNNSIEEILKFVIQQLSNIKIVPDDLFDSYAGQKSDYNYKSNKMPSELKSTVDRRNQRINDALLSEKIDINDLKVSAEKNREDLLSKKNYIIDKLTEFRTKEFSPNKLIKKLDIKNSSPKVFDELYNFIKFTLNNVSSDGSGQTIAKFTNINTTLLTTSIYNGWRQCIYDNEEIGDNVFPKRFYSIGNEGQLSLFYKFVDISTIYYDQNISEICNLIYNYIISEKNLNRNDILENIYNVANGIWQIVKLVIDKKIAKRLLIDSSISSAQGSLINFLKKIAQEPFVEIFFDTYGDEFYIIARQPPTDKVGIQSFLTNRYQGVDNIDFSDDSLNGEAIVNIDEIDVVSTDLVFDDSQVYSWYHFTPQAGLIGTAQKYPTAYIPAIYFEEYAKIWGSKPLDFIHNYMNYYAIYKEDSPQQEFSEHEKQMYYDMKYVIESMQYLPFSRKGTITIIGGDRRIKIGNPIRLTSTGEIFWVDSVSNNFSIHGGSINRVTTVQVSRGLNESFIFGMKGSELNDLFKNSGYKFSDDKVFSYFNIINTELDFSKKKKIKKYKYVQKKVDISKKDKSTIKNDNIVGSETTKPIDETTDPRNQLSYSNLNGPVRGNGLHKSNEEYVRELSSEAQPIFRRFLNELDQIGWDIIITSGFRTYSEQEKQKSLNNLNANPGTSAHNFGLAIDMNVIARRNINGITKGTQLFKAGIGKQNAYNYLNALAAKSGWEKSGIPKIAYKYGLIWGGDYNNYIDNVHFQLPTKGTAEYLRTQEINEKEAIEWVQVEDGEIESIDVESVFSNFKVDKEIFNFFLRKQQMGIISNNKSTIEKIKTNNAESTSNVANQEQLNSLSKEAKNKLKGRFTKFR